MRLRSTLTRSVLLCGVLLVLVNAQQKFSIPEVTIQAIQPRGIVVSLPDTPGTQHFAFHGNINTPIRGKEEGSINKETSRKRNGIWQIRDDNVELKAGDVINYWVFVQHNRLGFDKQEQKFTVTELVNDGTPPQIDTGGTATTCTNSVTTINDGQTVCSGTLIFEDNFDNIDDGKWQKQYYIAGKPDDEFVTYEPQNIQTSSGILALTASLRSNIDDLYLLDFSSGCTGTKCKDEAKGKLLPPIIAGQIKSKFKFKYGRIEIRAQLPKGDWVYPQINLDADNENEIYNNGRIWVAFSRGNANLQNGGNEIGNRIMYGGPVLSKTEPLRSSGLRQREIQGGTSWSDGYHTFILDWKPDGMTWRVDGDSMSIPNSNFNKELQVTLGIAAGGHANFPDGSTGKPWKTRQIQHMRVFWEDRSNWLPSWENQVSALKVDFIKITSL